MPTAHYQPWPVAVALLEQPYVAFATEAEGEAYKAKLNEQEERLKETRTDSTSVRAGDAQYFDRLIHDTHVKAADSGYRPAKEGEKQFDAELQRVLTLIGTPCISSCKRQIVDGDGRIGWIVEWWYYQPNGEIFHIDEWFVRRIDYH